MHAVVVVRSTELMARLYLCVPSATIESTAPSNARRSPGRSTGRCACLQRLLPRHPAATLWRRKQCLLSLPRPLQLPPPCYGHFEGDQRLYHAGILVVDVIPRCRYSRTMCNDLKLSLTTRHDEGMEECNPTKRWYDYSI